MGVYTYVKKPLGLSLSPRLQELLKRCQKGEAVEGIDFEYLIDEAARFETIESRINSGDYTIAESIQDKGVFIQDVLRDLMTELYMLEASKIGKDGTYSFALPHFSPRSEDNIEQLSAIDIERAIERALRMVEEMQAQFDANGDDLKVHAYFKHLQKAYGLEYIITAESTVKEVTSVLVDHIVAHVENETRLKAEAVKQLKSLKSE